VDVYKILLLMRFLKLSQWKVMTESAVAMPEVSFIYCQPTAGACSGQLHPSAENMVCLPSFTDSSLCNSVATQPLCEGLPDSPCEEDSVLSMSMAARSAELSLSHREQAFGKQIGRAERGYSTVHPMRELTL